MARQVPPADHRVNARRTSARIALISAALFLIVASFAGSAVGTRMPSALASTLNSVTDTYVPGADPWGTAFDSSGRVWVALPGCDGAACSSTSAPGKLGLYNPAASAWATVVTLPAGYGQPLFVAVDHSGKVWFTMPATNSIGRYDPASTTVTQWAVPTPGSGPWGIAIDSAGTIWFTEHYVNKIASFNPGTAAFQEVATADTNSNPYGIVIDSSNNVWFTENTDAVASVDEYTTAGVLKQFKVRSTSTAGTGLTPHLITIAANGSVWWSEGFAGAIASLNVAAAQPGTNSGVTENFYSHPCGNCGTHTSGIGVDSQGNIWWDDSLQSIFGSLPVGGGTFSEFSTPTANSHPHDGLNVDSQDRVWFDEEFANKLAEAVQPGSTTSPSPTPTTTSPSPSPTTTTTPPSTSLGTDTFHRANQALWGTAADGQTWGGDANTASAFSVSANAGLVKNTGGTSYSAVLGPTATDSEVTATGSLTTFTNSNLGDVLRWTDGNNWYKAYLDGTNLVIQKKVAGATTVLGTAPLAAAAGTSYTIHFRVVGSTLTANAWPSSGSEPAGWMITATDTSLASGQAGLRFLTQGGTATITSFQAAQV
jgi:streptogramin lyase